MNEKRMLETADTLKRLRDRKDELQARLKEVQARIDETEAQLVEMMTTEECTGFDRSGFRFSLVIREYPGAIPEEKEELYAQMRSHGFEHLFTINPMTLQSTIKELKPRYYSASKGGESMQATTERRQQILEYISIHRHVQYQDLMDEFHISKKTAQRDVEILSCSYPIYTRTTCAGGIFAMEGWYASKSYLHDDQEALLRKLLAGLQPEDQKTMQSILDAFAKPTKEANR